MTKTRVAFLGLGIMGSGMARRLLANGYPVSVFNRNRERAIPLLTEAANVAASPREAASKAEVVISMVADDSASRAVWLGENGALADVQAGAVCIESSTLSLGWVRELASAVTTRGCEFLDAPVTGTKSHAASGELNFLVGGETASLEKVRP